VGAGQEKPVATAESEWLDEADDTEEPTDQEPDPETIEDDGEPVPDDAAAFVEELSEEQKLDAKRGAAERRKRRLAQTEARYNKLTARGGALTESESKELQEKEAELEVLREQVRWDTESEQFWSTSDEELQVAQAEADEAVLAARREHNELKAAPLAMMGDIERRVTTRKLEEARKRELETLAANLNVTAERERRELIAKHGDKLDKLLAFVPPRPQFPEGMLDPEKKTRR
jgi:hypothetical protein